MNHDPTNESAASATGGTGRTYSAFLPLLLALIAFLLILSWNLYGVVRQHNYLQRMEVQIGEASAQSAQAEQKLKAMLSDLVDLAAQDEDAAAIIRRYRIVKNAPARTK